ncbi:MAG: metallophosphoesterase [Clostridia bacterium]|nr:metallophosphoesterase [Clostridia bacterium]
MKVRLRRNGFLIVVVSLALVLLTTILCLSVSASAADAEEFVKESEVTIAHFSDTHYYSFRLLYTEGDPVDTTDDDYFYNYVMRKSTKMWMEGELIFDAGLRTLLTAATEDPENAPDYLILSGDVAQDGELLGHIDVANKLRKVQNYIRSHGKPNFQIFVIMGNHDLYNPESWRFDNETGEKEGFFFTSRVDAVRIFAGLGYPNMTEEEAEVFYGGLSEKDLPAGYKYVRSDLSDAFEYRWQFVKEDENNAVRTFRFGAGYYTAEDVTFAKLAEADEVKLVNKSAYFNVSHQSYAKERLNSGLDIEIGQMTGIAARLDGMFSILFLDVIQSCAEYGHVLGGQLQFSTWDWLDDEQNRTFAKSNEETLVVATAHHSILPHWDMEEEVTTGFIMYNWIEVADFLADYGVRYVYTGHQHANDATSYVSGNGNQLIDMESAAHISVGSQIKWTTIERGRVDGKYAEKAILDAYENQPIAANEDIDPVDPTKGLGNAHLFDRVLEDDKYGYVQANQMNLSGTGPYINYETEQIADYSLYAQHRIYENVVDNYLDMFLRPEITEKVGGIVEGLKFSIGPVTLDLGKNADDVVTIVNNLVKGINEKVLADYTYQGPHARLKGADMKLFAFAEDLVYRVVNTAVAEDTDILDTVLYAYMAHSRGTNVDTFEELPANYQAVLKKVKSGEFVDMLVKMLLDEDKGLMRIINGLCANTFDLAKDVDPDFHGTINLALKVIIGDESKEQYDYLANFNLGDYVARASKTAFVKDLLAKLPVQVDLENMTIPEVIDDIVDKYLTDNFKQGLGEYAYNIAVSLGVDGDRTDVITKDHNVVLKVYKDEAYTYVAKDRNEVVTVENGKLPSMITNVFGSDPATTRNFTYFTDRRITKGAIQYTTDAAKSANVVTKEATTERYASTKALIDLGIWCQAGYYETSRHTVKLTGLTANTTYYFRLGEPDKGYWSEWYEFRTARSDAFEVLIASDLQASTESSYQRIDKIYRDVLAKQFASGVDFFINPGDVVDNSRNATQFKWFLNSSADIYAKNAMVVVAGNHDNKYFDIEKAKNLEYYAKDVTYKGNSVSGVKDVVTNKYNYLWSHYDYDLTDDQNQTTGFYYSFDYAGVHFTMLNTNDIDVQNQLGQDQFAWLVEDLKASKAEYKVVVMHKSLYSEGSHSFDKDVVGMRKQLTPVFREQGVNLVIAGHDHTYNETFYLDATGNKVSTDANGSNEISKDGTLYVTMGTMGEKFYNYKDNGAVPTQTGAYLHDEGRLSDPTFGKLVLSDGKLYYYGYQYIREMSEDGYSDVLGGEIKAIAKGEYKDGLSAGAVAGIVVGSVGGAAIIAGGVLLILKKKGILFAAKAVK